MSKLILKVAAGEIAQVSSGGDYQSLLPDGSVCKPSIILLLRVKKSSVHVNGSISIYISHTFKVRICPKTKPTNVHMTMHTEKQSCHDNKKNGLGRRSDTHPGYIPCSWSFERVFDHCPNKLSQPIFKCMKRQIKWSHEIGYNAH